MNEKDIEIYFGAPPYSFVSVEVVSEKINEILVRDCLGFSVWNSSGVSEVIFNKYISKSFRKEVLEDMICEHISKNLETTILYKITQEGLDAQLDLYMSREYPWKIRFDYDAATQTFSVRGFWALTSFQKTMNQQTLSSIDDVKNIQ